MGGGSLTLSGSCRGKLARSRDLIIGSVVQYRCAAATLVENSATNTITNHVTSLKNKMLGKKSLKKKRENAERDEG